MFRKKILVVDDEVDYAEMLKIRLASAGYYVLLAHDGDTALRMAADEKPNLMLLDVMMPGKDGFAVLDAIRHSPETRRLRVIMLTAKGESKSIFRAQEMGATDYLTKPCDSKELLDLVAKHA